MIDSVAVFCTIYGTYGGYLIDRCILMYSYYATFRCDLVTNSILLAPWSAAYQNNETINCMCMGSY